MARAQAFLPDGTEINIRHIEQTDLDSINLRCWPERGTLDRLFADQGTIGMAAWEKDKCVGLLHCYRVGLPDGVNENWPEWSAWWWQGGRVFSREGQWGPRKVDLGLTGQGWCHACIHVGRTLESAKTDEPDAKYFGHGIGTALCTGSVEWARDNGYSAVLAAGAADGLIEFARWGGILPWTTYAKQGFRAYSVPAEESDKLPGWAKGEIHEPIRSEISSALKSRPVHEILLRLMVLDLEND